MFDVAFTDMMDEAIAATGVKPKIKIVLGETAGWVSYRELAGELFQHTIDILAKFKIPRIIEFATEVPKTISGKIRRIELRENEIARQTNDSGPATNEYFYWDFPELSSSARN